ncbi:hypothetical protein CWO92_09010 [Heyndrickxia camelliae]|uniref:Uncharacterized protein n=1 Tax=Heyndrickxia camelliae TaxID=1707093 RepID=A0A2N3LLC0_9BACI|nr:hypothetical protein CWO92_09010 [Heyndrickxia camelliae]
MKKFMGVIVILVVLFLMLHSNPKLALRTQVFFTGHPITAFNTGIVDDEYHNKTDKKRLA